MIIVLQTSLTQIIAESLSFHDYRLSSFESCSTQSVVNRSVFIMIVFQNMLN
jgi:hypothetical protein